jgi:hypothetical protein
MTTTFANGDPIEFRCPATVVRFALPFLVVIALDEPSGDHEVTVPPTTLRLLSEPRELTLEERMELPMDDELIAAVECAVSQLVGPDGALEEGIDEVALTAIDAVFSRGEVEKRVEHFRTGDRVEFKCKGMVITTGPASAVIMLDRIGHKMTTPLTTLANLAEREMTLEDAMELDMDDELWSTVIQVISPMVGHDNKFTKPLRQVARAAAEAVYTFYSPDKL